MAAKPPGKPSVPLNTALLAAWLLLAIQPALAQSLEESAGNEPSATTESAADKPELDTLIRQLDANRFAERQNASEALARLGVQAIPALTKAALGDSREAITRSVDILKRHFHDGPPEAKAAAKEALERIQAADNPVASRAAKAALEPEMPQPPPNALPVPGIAPAQIQIRVQAIAGGNGRRVQIRNVNGVKTIEVQEQDRKVTIQQDPNQGIEVQVTEKKDGKEVTQKYTAKNEEELKKKHPEGYKLFQKYSQNQPGIQIQAVPLGGLPQQVPGARVLPIRPALPARQIEPRTRIADRLKEIQKQLDSARETIKQLSDKNDSADGESLRKGLEQLEQAAKELEEARQKLLPGS